MRSLSVVNDQKQYSESQRFSYQGDFKQGLPLFYLKLIYLYCQVVKAVHKGNKRKKQKNCPLSSCQFPIKEEETHHDDRRNQIWQNETNYIHHILLHTLCTDNWTTPITQGKVREDNDDQKENRDNQRRYIGHNHIFQHEVDEVKVLAWCQFFPVDQASDEDNPKVGSDCEGKSARQTDDTEHSVYVLDIAEHLEHRLQDFIEDENGQHLHDGDAGGPPPEEVESQDNQQAQADDG